MKFGNYCGRIQIVLMDQELSGCRVSPSRVCLCSVGIGLPIRFALQPSPIGGRYCLSKIVLGIQDDAKTVDSLARLFKQSCPSVQFVLTGSGEETLAFLQDAAWAGLTPELILVDMHSLGDAGPRSSGSTAHERLVLAYSCDDAHGCTFAGQRDQSLLDGSYSVYRRATYS
jgi:hypothetical protein